MRFQACPINYIEHPGMKIIEGTGRLTRLLDHTVRDRFDMDPILGRSRGRQTVAGVLTFRVIFNALNVRV